MTFSSTFARLGLAATLALSGTFHAQAFDIASMTEEEREVFHAEIREFILDNPEVLFEAVERYEAQQEQAQAATEQQLLSQLSGEIFNSSDDLIMGNPDGDVTFVEFLDYRCGYCKKAFPEVKSLLKADGNIKVIVKEYPILGEASVEASRFALAARVVAGDDAYETVHDAMMEMRGSLTPGGMRKIAKKADLDYDAIAAKMESDEVTAVIARNHALGRQLQINGTPSFIVSDAIIRGYLPYDEMAKIVAEIRAEG